MEELLPLLQNHGGEGAIAIAALLLVKRAFTRIDDLDDKIDEQIARLWERIADGDNKK